MSIVENFKTKWTKLHDYCTSGYKVTGRNLKRETVERAVQLSHEKYCSASIMLAKTAEITHSLELIELA